MKFFITIARFASVVFLLTIAQPVLAQQPYPSRPVRYILPYPPGGSTDPMARYICGKLSEVWGRSVVVDNRPGGNTVIGTDA
ncbi:MAG: tripartite tricarboxylate transporter substrate binding protein, partial [Burkholderiales bacterium]